MDVAAYLQCFENSLTSYSGDDPLDCWDKFVNFLEQKLPAEGSSGMSLVFDALVQRFLNVERYANDVRFVNYCIRCASYYSDPVALYSLVFGRGVGTRTAALYVAWAQQFEQRGMMDQADAVYQKALENRAQPADAVLQEYREFQTRTSGRQPPSAGRNPLQDSHLTNQMSSHREPLDQNKASVPKLCHSCSATVDCAPNPPVNKMTVIVSRSETSGALPSNHGAGVQTVSEYMKDELICEGSELSFEELRAEKYFRKLREKQEKGRSEHAERTLREPDKEVPRVKCWLDEINQGLEACGGFSGHASAQQPSADLNLPQQVFTRPPPSNRLSSRRSLGLRLHTEPPLIHDIAAATEQQSLEVSRHPSVAPDGSAHLSHTNVTPASTAGESVAWPSSDQQLASPALHRPACQDASRVHEHGAAHRDGSWLPEPEEKLDVSLGGTANLSHVTPNSSLGFVQATPSRVLPSPTVNTREALDVIMDMFQAPTFVEDPFSSTSQLHAAEKDFVSGTRGAISTLTMPAAAAGAAPFTIFQDGDDDKENCSSQFSKLLAQSEEVCRDFSATAPSAAGTLKPAKSLAEIGVLKADKPNDTPPELASDESTMWGARYNSLNSLAACPNSTTDFAMLAQFVSTPFTHKTPVYQDLENCGGDSDDNAFIRRQTKKLSPIIEQSPCDDKFSETAVSQLVPSSERQGTIVGEGLAATQHCLTSSSITMVQPPPPAVLSFRDQTLCPADPSGSGGPGWEVYTSPKHPPKPASQSPVRPSKSESLKIPEDSDEPTHPDPAQDQACDVPMSPECSLKSGWFIVRSPEATAEADLDAFLSPCRPKKGDPTSSNTWDVPMSPLQPPLCADVPMSPLQPPLCADVPMSPLQISTVDEPMMSPGGGLRPGTDVSTDAGAVQLVSDPWNNKLIADLLSALSPPLTSHPRCITWQRSVPRIAPKMTISMGSASLRVDSVLGEGAFATVYQVTDPMTSEKMVLKVQKPANPWEFYINTQLDARLRPDVRHLYGSIRSAHLFHDGSVMLGELHNYGTLLNVVNIYKSLSDKVMPQPLVLYFTVCILHMVEQLHSIHIVHADIKPDNVLLGDGFLESRSFQSDGVDHGLVLIDLGQSIDMELFPEGTAFTAKCLTSGFQCTEMLSGKPWNYQTDYFGIAGTVYCLLFGTYMQVTREGGAWRTNGAFRRNPHGDLWQEFFHTLLNVPERSSPPSLRRLRCRLASVLQDNYSRKLSTLKSRLVVLLLENHKAARR
ncbi:mitotic checkpoint serine/threonine-protein kinase BUB1 [Xenentodon cancila]